MNVVALTGRLTNDPVRKETSAGVVVEFRLAVDARPRLFIDVETWGPPAGKAAAHLTKRRRVGVSGSLVCDEWHDRSGEKRSRAKVRVREITYLDSPRAGDPDE